MVFPALIRASVVPFAVTYSYSVVAYAMYCATPMGQGALDGVKDDTMVQRRAHRYTTVDGTMEVLDEVKGLHWCLRCEVVAWGM